MGITSKTVGDNSELEITVTGTFDFNSVQEFRSCYSGSETYKKYSINLAQVDHIDSSALGMLLNMRKTVGDECQITISNCKPNIKKIFMISRFDKKFNFS